MIDVQNVSKTFGQRCAVNAVSFSIARGETVGFLGPNGAGKTTLMRMMTGYLPPTAGRVTIAGMNLFDHPDEVKRRIGYLPEHPPLYPDLTVREYLRFAGRLRGVDGRRLADRIDQVAAMCGLSRILHRLTGNLSKGFRQRVGLAQALVHDPDVLILDEPTLGLDPGQIIEIRGLVRELGRERTVVLSSHVMQDVTAVCGSVAIFHEGRLLLMDRIERLSREAGGERLRVVPARPDRFDSAGLLRLGGVVSVQKKNAGEWEVTQRAGTDCREAVADFLLHSGAGLLELRSRRVSLEELFLRVVTGQNDTEIERNV